MSRAKAVFIPPAKLVVVARSSYPIQRAGKSADFPALCYLSSLLAAVQDGRQGLIDQQAQYGVQQTLDQREGHVKDHKALDQAVGRGQNGLIHSQNGFQRHVVELYIGRVGDEVVGGHAEHGHDGCTGNGTQNGGLAALVALVDKARHSGEHRAQHKVAQLTHAGGGGALDDDVQQVLHKADDHAVHRTQCKSTQQGGQVGEVHLDKGRDEHRQRELDEHQDKGHRAEHGGNGQVAGRVFLHGNILPGRSGPKSKIGKPLSRGSEPGRQSKTRPAAANTATGRVDTNVVCRFLHPDYTVGPGVAPGQHPCGWSRTLPPVGNCTPP